MKDELGLRMKNYEQVTEIFLTRRIPVIIRIDGKAFHSFTRRFYKKGFSETFILKMQEVALEVSKEIQGCSFAYGQSDEISFLLTDYKTIRTQAWFDYNLRKLCSVSSSTASQVLKATNGIFDSRAFNLPQDEVVNYFIWRQQDAVRNSIQMAGQEHFSSKQLNGKNCKEIQEMLFKEKGINFNDYSVLRKRGYCIVNKEIDSNIPIFTQDRNYIEKFVNIKED